MALVLRPDIAARQSRIGGRPTSDVSRLANFADALNRWHAPNAPRLLWIDHWDTSFPSLYDVFLAVRHGLGESRLLSDAPGHYFEPFAYDERDQTKISPEQARQTGILIGLMSLVMTNGWDGWLLGTGTDRVEFWEGNLFFYSSDESRLKDAKLLMGQFNCSSDLA